MSHSRAQLPADLLASFDEEDCRADIAVALRKADINASDVTEKLLGKVFSAIRVVYDQKDQIARATQRRIGKRIWDLAQPDRPQIHRLRRAITSAKDGELDIFEPYARRALANLARTDRLLEIRAARPGRSRAGQASLPFLAHLEIDDAWIAAGGIRQWALHAPDSQLVWLVKAAFRPFGPEDTGGRPSAGARHKLIKLLAYAWLNATGMMPAPGRSDHKGFGELVHSVCSWLGLPGADYLLRSYWEGMPEEAPSDKRATKTGRRAASRPE